jgi:hypothetical protein
MHFVRFSPHPLQKHPPPLASLCITNQLCIASVEDEVPNVVGQKTTKKAGVAGVKRTLTSKAVTCAWVVADEMG